MQHIKFKIWDYETSKMYTVTSLFLNNDTWKHLCEVLDDNGTKRICSNFKLLPFTGLNDIQGEEIYLGDIVAAYEEKYNIGEPSDLIYVGEVIWDEAECNYSLKGHEPNSLGCYPILKKLSNVFEMDKIPVSNDCIADKLQYMLLLSGSRISLYEEGNSEPVEIHYLNEYLGLETNLEEIETAFVKEINIYSRIIVEFCFQDYYQVFEFNKTDNLWYASNSVEFFIHK